MTRWVSAPLSIMVPMCGCREASTPRLGGVVGDPVQVGEQGLPARLVELRPGVVAGLTGAGREDDHAGLGGQALVDERVDAGDRVVAGVVQDGHVEAADGAESVRRQLGDAGLRLGLEEPGRTELGGHEPEALHLGQHSLRRQLVAPAGHLAEAPGDGCAGDAVNGEGSGHDTDPIEGPN